MSAKKKSSDSEKKISLYTIVLSDDHAAKLNDWCLARGLERKDVQYSKFAFIGEDINIVMYTSGKLVVQGKGTEDFVKYVLETYITETPQMGYEEIQHPEWFEPHAGLDESGKGDVFGPLVVACVIADGDMVREWIKAGVKDSKKISSSNNILLLDKKIRSTEGVVVKTVCAGMAKYNELYNKFVNLNKLLAWMHSKAITEALEERAVEWGMLDQFSKQPLVQRLLKCETFELKMQTKAEADPVVAAASIVARAEYLRQMKKLSELAGFEIPKGASIRTQNQIKVLEEKVGREGLNNFCKMHFKCSKIQE